MKRIRIPNAWFTRFLRVLHLLCTISLFLCFAAILWLCTQNWWDFQMPELKPLFPGTLVLKLILFPIILYVIFLLKTLKPAFTSILHELVCLGCALSICLLVADRYIRLAEHMLFGPGGVDLRFSSDAAMPAYWMTLNVTVIVVFMQLVRTTLRIVYSKNKQK